ncbi:hypothetical protein P22_1669 [Propionispora sp. 2/2-37]|uniref:PTS sugar transporter subunit IIA n=1 Tax=Propionispora sp. 2/2-37 TaxID=1677858 RepID=UPI0006BB75A0|nr:PTS glucose transporter subunit IIA [Propionispora sp. 2/2-37]CUH95595.1 hypothetical protein P22_1669 [Propionispora sp. 2/2-37]
MFNLLGKKKQKVALFAPAKGRIMDISDVPDDVFSQKMMGDGIAIDPINDEIVAPCDGQIVLLAQTKHAIAMRCRGDLELLIHIGLDTVDLGGEGFVSYVGTGEMVCIGERLIGFDREFLESQGKSLITALVITNNDAKVEQIEKNISNTGGEVMLVTCK